jgi:hypothetical protein
VTEGEDRAWRRLGELLMARRVELGFPIRSAFAKHLGMSHDRTLADLENARRRNFDQTTLLFVERGYGWGSGSIRAVLAGGEPSVTEENPRPEGEIDPGSVGSRRQDAEYVAHRHPDDPPTGGLSDEEVLALIRENRRLADELERRIKGGSPGPVGGAP